VDPEPGVEEIAAMHSRRSIPRRDFLKTASAAVAATAVGSTAWAREKSVPGYLAGYEMLCAEDPREAARKWFADARFGLFLHYGLYSLLGRGEWVMYHEKIPLAEYEQLQHKFTAERFDADAITDLALEAGMRYVNLTARHHDGFCLFETKTSAYNSVRSPARRDLIGELAEACQKKGLGVFFYYSYAVDWRHPYTYPRWMGSMGKPEYAQPEPRFKYKKPEDFGRYIEDAHEQVRELLSNYGPVSGIWFDPIMAYFAQPDLFPIHETYAMIRRLQPQTLISFKQGATGTEDFAAPERSGVSLADRVKRARFGPKSVKIATEAWDSNKTKHNEICDTMQPRVWGYRKDDDGQHDTRDDVLRKLAAAAGQGCHLLLNTGPLPDGSIHTGDAATLREVGKYVRGHGWPKPEDWPSAGDTGRGENPAKQA
jgi:alpha-L-fucosidase